MPKKEYRSMSPVLGVDRRDFLKTMGTASAAVAGGAVLGVPTFGDEKPASKPPEEIETNIAEFMKVPRGPHAIPGPFPGRVVQVTDPRSYRKGKVNSKVVARMLKRGLNGLTGKDEKESFDLLFTKDDVVGIKVNPVGAPLIHNRPELVDAVIEWLVKGGLPRGNIVIWDRFDIMLEEAGYTKERFPGVRIEALQTMAEEGDSWKDEKGEHVSAGNFDKKAYYYAKGILGKGVRGYKDDEFYRNQHVFVGEYSYFGNLITKDLTKIINMSVFKNTGNGISMATKNMGYGAVCNTGRLHQPLFFRVCTEVIAAPWIRDKMVLNITDGLRGQYDGGPMSSEPHIYPNQAIYLATDPFALDRYCHDLMVAKRKAEGVKVNDHPRYTDYFREAQSLGLGWGDPEKIQVIKV